MTNKPLVSIVTPSYNQAQFLRTTIHSVLNQDYRYVEYIVMDGGSTDESIDIIRQAEDRLAYWVSEPDQGQADAINRGWQRSSGEILAWLNSDDTYEAGAVSAAVDVFQHRPDIDIVTGDCQVIDALGNVMHSLPSGDFDILTILSGNSLPQQGVFCRRTAVEAAGWLDSGLNYVFDWALWLKLWLNGAKFHHLPSLLANFRVWGHAKTASDTIGESLTGGIRFARERLQALTDMLDTAQAQGFVANSTLLETARAGNMLELALLHQLANEPTVVADYLDHYVDTAFPAQLALLQAQMLAAHLAYLDGDIDRAIIRFADAALSRLKQAGHLVDLSSWARTLRSETYLVQAWHAVHLADNRRAASRFLKAIAVNPRLLSQRRVISPTLKHIALAGYGISTNTRIDNFGLNSSKF